MIGTNKLLSITISTVADPVGSRLGIMNTLASERRRRGGDVTVTGDGR